MRSAPPEGAAAGPVLVDGVREDDKEGLDLKYSTQECIFVLKAYTILYSENPESIFLLPLLQIQMLTFAHNLLCPFLIKYPIVLIMVCVL
jgi:hypothetical protein